MLVRRVASKVPLTCGNTCWGMITLLWHVYYEGHSVEVNRGITVPMFDTSKGWLYTCECGIMVAR